MPLRIKKAYNVYMREYMRNYRARLKRLTVETPEHFEVTRKMPKEPLVNKIELTPEEIQQYSSILNKAMPDFMTLGAVHTRRLILESDISQLEWMIRILNSSKEEKAKALRALKLDLHEKTNTLKAVKKLYWNVRKRHLLKMKEYKEVI